MPSVGVRCHELRIDDQGVTWRVLYYIETDAGVILEIFGKKTRTTPKQVIETAKRRLRHYRRLSNED